ncbi:basic 7S globulin-like [Chenopodium quinoa]|uniref:basic 7S globulin-like n=1 Tax=Chenopodium quinoa TaxID=63459 RepID=UPI000B78F737|nr:basic 7S globulin-like [Chenopodium quinoa]
MASFTFSLLLLSLILPLSLSSTLILPLNKHKSTNLYLTRIHHGSHLEPAELVVDLNSPLLWVDCSSSPQPTAVNCRSIQCTSAASNPCPTSPSANQACSLPLRNPATSGSATGELVDSVISFNDKVLVVDSFLLSCAPSKILSGLPTGSKGVFGLGKTRIGPVSQISHIMEYPKKFSLCLSENNGMILTGNDEGEVFKSMSYTPLIDNEGDSSYNINLKSIKVQNKKLPFDDDTISTIKISTVDPYSKMETRIYQELVQAFITEAEALNPNLLRVPPEGGFEVCFGVEGFRVSPVIDLILQSEMVKWRIYGHNSMVKISDEIICLGFLDGGSDLNGSSMILGGHQLEDNLLEFDLGSSMLGFSSSLLKLQSSCSQLSSSAMVQQMGAQSS